MSSLVKRAALSCFVALSIAAGANAATVTLSPVPDVAEANPLADSVTGTVFQNVTGSIGGVRRSPWQGTTVNENAEDSFYSSISRNSSATYNFDTLMGSIRFLWGSPDTYNNLDILLTGADGTVTVNGRAAQGQVPTSAQFVTISDIGVFDSVTFKSGNNAFEFSNLSTTPIPLPAALPLLLAGIVGLGIMGRRRRGTDA